MYDQSTGLTLFAVEPTTPVQSGPRHHGYIGRCPRKGCDHATRTDTGFMGECPQHGRYRLEALWGQVSDHRCYAACMGAVGPSCECSCGGANHGAWHAR
jgi:hypothetical protein